MRDICTFPVRHLPFLKEVDVAVKSIVNEESFQKHGRKLVKVTSSSVMNKELQNSFRMCWLSVFAVLKSYLHLQFQKYLKTWFLSFVTPEYKNL